MVLICQNAYIVKQVNQSNQIKFGVMNINLEKFKQSFNEFGINKFRKIQKDYKKNAKKSLKNNGRFVYFIFFCAFLNVVFFGAKRYFDFLDEKTIQYKSLAVQVAKEYEGFLNYSQLLLNSINHEILKSKAFGVESFEILSSMDRIRNENHVANEVFSEGMLYWIDSNKYLIASSAGKVLKPIDLSSRDYLEKTEHEPWKLHVGKTVVGALSGQNILPIAVGVVSKNGYHVGTSVLSVKVESLIEKFKISSMKNSGNFAILNYDGKIVLDSNEKYFSENNAFLSKVKTMNFLKKSNIFSSFNLLKRSDLFVVSEEVFEYPFVVVYAVKNKIIYQQLFVEMLPYFIEALFLLVILASYLSMMRVGRVGRY